MKSVIQAIASTQRGSFLMMKAILSSIVLNLDLLKRECKYSQGNEKSAIKL
jgi:hypothetical protein